MKASPLSASLYSRLHTCADTHRPISAKIFIKSCKERETRKNTSVHPMELLAPPLFTSLPLSGNAKKNLRWAQQHRADQPDGSASTDRGLPSVLCCQRSYALCYTIVLCLMCVCVFVCCKWKEGESKRVQPLLSRRETAWISQAYRGGSWCCPPQSTGLSHLKNWCFSFFLFATKKISFSNLFKKTQ